MDIATLRNNNNGPDNSGGDNIELLTPLIREEFEALNTIHSTGNVDFMNFASAVQPNNTHKNRYYNILANEDTRVKLTPLDIGEEDYINANYIDGEVVGSKRAYILTQAPLPTTMADFWRMVWHEKSPVIACLTMLRENNKQKAHKYWPEDGQIQQYGKIFVIHNLSVLFKNIIVRSFTIWKEGDNAQPMEVLQLHYQDWPDFGTPASTEPIRAMSSLLSALKDRGRQRNGVSGPAIVHCSAGVGRAGTFVATHITITKLEQMQLNSSTGVTITSLFEYPITIKETVSKLRHQRAGIVQTLDQYVFIYRAVADALTHQPEPKRIAPKKPDPCNTLQLSQEVGVGGDANNMKDKVGVSAFLDILSIRNTSKCTDNPTGKPLSSSSEQIA